jgi:predicted permease
VNEHADYGQTKITGRAEYKYRQSSVWRDEVHRSDAASGEQILSGWIRQSLQRLGSFFRRDQLDQEFDAEVTAHLELAIETNLKRGMPPEEARRVALIHFGGMQQAKEQHRDTRGLPFLQVLLQDLRFGLRMLRKNPGFAATAVLVLALGIGANTALFSVVNGVLLRPLPYPNPHELVVLRESKPNFATGSVSYPNFLDWQKDNHTFSSMAVMRGNRAFILTGRGEPEQLNAIFVSSGFFTQLGVNPIQGRMFARDDDRLGAAPTVMITAEFWSRKFGSASDVIGTSLTLDGKDYTIVGVIPAKFDLMGTGRSVEAYVPIGQWNNPLLTNRAAGLGIGGIGRLKPGVSIEQARADMERVTQNLAAAYPDANKGVGAALIPLRKWTLGSIETFLFVLFGAVGFVLLIACVNVANLLLARSSGRAHEFAVRASLGAGQGRIIRQLLAESTLVAAIGGSLGLLLAAAGTQAALRALPATLPRAAEVGMDSHVLIFAMAISIASGILFGLAPALRTARRNPQETLKEGGRGGSGTRNRMQGVLVAAEISLALVLLIGAGLMLRTLAALWNVNLGFEANKVMTFGLSLPPSMMNASPDAVRAALREAHDKIQSAPGVQAVSYSWGAIPLSGDDEWLFWIDGQAKPTSENDMNWALDYVVGSDYQKIMGIPLKSGRFFTEMDNEHAPRVAVVDDVLANKFFPGQNPIGKRLHLNSTRETVEIVGVVGHVIQWGLDTDDKEALRAQLYTPFMQLPDEEAARSASGLGVLVRADKPEAVFESIRQVNSQAGGQRVLFGAQTMKEIVADSLAERRISMILFGLFAGLALILSSVGIYGVVSYLASQRTREIGVRMALGAQRADVLRMILGQGAKITAIGLFIGLLAAFGLTRLLSKLLFGVGATDPVTFVAVSLLLGVVALAACYLPARRAMRVDPIIALRYE